MQIKNYLKRAVRYILHGQPTTVIKANICYSNPASLLTGRKILITGGGRGLGLAIAKKAIDEGAKVCILGRNEANLKAASKELGCKFIVGDISLIGTSDSYIDTAISTLGGLDVLINNAGISLHERNILDVTEENFDSQFNCNLRGAYFLSKSFIMKTIPHSQRNILFISSERGFQADDLPYGLTKVAINSLIKGLAYRFLNENIRVNGVAPGVTSSDMTGVAQDGNLYYPYNSANRAYLPEEVAEVCTYLLSDLSSCISGEIIQCNQAKTVNVHWR